LVVIWGRFEWNSEKSINILSTTLELAMEARKMKQKSTYLLDLTKIGGKGDFLCPFCGNTISPDDCTENAYTIIEAKVNSHGLDEVVICCNKCGAQLHLTGFSMLEEPSNIDTKNLLRKRKNRYPK
jgi:hypothetical protein